ncbi:MAG: membrane protein insertase YidC [Candidatus Omnitrophota bacterium]
MDKKFFVAIALSVLVLIIYPALLAKLYPSAQKNTQSQPVYTPPAAPSSVISNAAVPAALNIAPATDEGREAVLENKFFKVVFSNIGAGANKVYLKNAPGSPHNELLLFDATAQKNKPLMLDLMPGVRPPLEYNFVKGSDNIFFSAPYSSSIYIEKTITVSQDEPVLKLEVKIVNKSDKEERLTYSITGPVSLYSELKQDEGVVGFNVKSDSTVFRDSAIKVKSPKAYKGKFPWVSVRNRYFYFAVKPQSALPEVSIEREDKGWVYSKLLQGDIVLKPQETVSTSYTIYIGPLKSSELKKYGLNEMLHFGFFDPVGKLLLWLLTACYSVTKNYGVAIILLTILTCLALFPLSFKSMLSMRQLQMLQPHMEKIKKDFKDNPQKLNKETMELYKRHKVNPFGGCLPLVLQMPIFIALYQVILQSIELKGARFLWIKDLSLPDALALPFALPFLGNHINLLPVLMIGAMFFQQKFANPMAKTQDEQTKMLSFIMPIMFGFIFYNLAAALVLYWFTNTVVMMMLQYFILHPILLKKEAV